MLRGLVLLFLVVDVALFFWLRSDPPWGQAEREPERLARQVSPETIQVEPDLPASAGPSATRPPSVPAVAESASAGNFDPPAAGSR